MESRFTQADFTGKQIGIYSQRDWTNSIDKIKFNQLVDDVAEKCEVAHAANFAELAN